MALLGIETALELKEPRLYYKYAVLKEKLLTEVYTRWAQGFPEGNDHGPEHIKRVLEKLDQLVGPNPIGTSIRPYELYLVMMSILYHDIGILRSRKNHPDEASNELGKKISGTPFYEHDNDNNLFDPFDRDVIRAAVVSHSNSNDIERECQAFPHEFSIGLHVVRPRFIAALVRLADELDEDYRRAPQSAEQLTQLPKGSSFYWRFCQRISGIRAERDQHIIVIDAKLEMDDVTYIVEVNKNEQLFTSAFANKLAKINEELRYTNQFLTPALTYARILVSLRPPDNHPTWVSPKEFFFADGTSSADFLSVLSDVLAPKPKPTGSKALALRFFDGLWVDPVSINVTMRSLASGSSTVDINWPQETQILIDTVNSFVTELEEYSRPTSRFYHWSPDRAAFLHGMGDDLCQYAKQIQQRVPVRVPLLWNGMKGYFSPSSIEEALKNFLALSNLKVQLKFALYLHSNFLDEREIIPSHLKNWINIKWAHTRRVFECLFATDEPIYSARIRNVSNVSFDHDIYGPKSKVLQAYFEYRFTNSRIINGWFAPHVIPQIELIISEEDSRDLNCVIEYCEEAWISKTGDQNDNEVI
jgi:hypothetical protein